VTFTDFFLEIISSFTALRASVESLTFQVTHARFAGVAADHQQQRVVVDRPFLLSRPVLGDRVRDQVLAARSRTFSFSV